MYQLIVPAILLVAALSQRKGSTPAQAAPAPQPRARALRPQPRAAQPTAAAPVAVRRIKRKRSKGFRVPVLAPAPAPPPGGAPARVTVEHPEVLPVGVHTADQAAVDAAVSQALRDAPNPDTAERERQAQAARDLTRFLIRTGRFGTLKDRPQEVIAAQTALGVKPDGIVGPRTRAAAAAVGVALPPIVHPPKKRK